jgi:membrane-associated phospholipid phosphatase
MRNIVFLFFFLCSTLGFSENLDLLLLDKINSPQKQVMDNGFLLISNTTPFVMMATPGIIGIAGLIEKDSAKIINALYIGASIVFCEGLTYVLKQSINRTRPYDKYDFIGAKTSVNSPSFPSAHSSGAFSTATALSLAYPRWYIIAPSFLWAGSVAYSRMHLGVHYPSDVLAGAALGVGSAFLCRQANLYLQKKLGYKQHKPQTIIY